MCGRTGIGKSTALAHLAAVFPDDAGLRLCDGRQVVRDGAGPVTVSTVRSRPDRGITFRLQAWTDDDVIEYLLTVHPEDVGRVLTEWQSGAPHDLREWPGTCKQVLAALAADSSLRGPRSGLTIVLAEHLGEDFLAAVELALRTSSDVPNAAPHHPDAQRAHLLGSETARGVLAAGWFLDTAKQQPRWQVINIRWHEELRHAIAHALNTDIDLRSSLLELVRQPRVRHKALVYSALALHEPGYRPPRAFRGKMVNAWLPSIDLHDHHIRANLDNANLDGANLRNTQFRDCDLNFASMRGARADNAEFYRVHASQLKAASIEAAHATWSNSRLSYSDFQNAELSHANFTGSQLNGANLSGASLRNAKLANVNLRNANLAHADLEGANLMAASFERVDLRETQLRAAQLQFADLLHCNLEGLVAPDLTASNTKFFACDLSGVVWAQADLRKASFAKCGLAGVDWEGADLRGADLRRATFHLGNSRCGLIDSPIAGEGSRTGFYTDESFEDRFQTPEDIRKANLRNCDLRYAQLVGVDLYLVDLRGATLDPSQRLWAKRCRAILDRPDERPNEASQ